jgi:hypothetical protein
MTPLRAVCVHEAGHIIGGRSQGIEVLWARADATSGATQFSIRRDELPQLGLRAAVALLGGPLLEKMLGSNEWESRSKSDFEQAAFALKHTQVKHSDVVQFTRRIISTWLGTADLIADYLEVHAHLDAQKIEEIYTYRR